MSAVMASHIPHVCFTVVDTDAAKIAQWNQQDLYFPCEASVSSFVLGLLDEQGVHYAPNLSLSTNVRGALAAADLIFLRVDAPLQAHGNSVIEGIDLRNVHAAAHGNARAAVKSTIVVERTTVPSHVAGFIWDILSFQGRPGIQHSVLSNPNFLIKHFHLSDLVYPDRILIGSLADDRGLSTAAILADLYAKWVP